MLAWLVSDFQDESGELVNTRIGANVTSARVPGYPLSGKPSASEQVQKHVIDHDRICW